MTLSEETTVSENPTPVLSELPDEAARLGALADERGVRMRLLGGVGIRRLLGDRRPASRRRRSDDLDYLTDRGSARDVEALLGDAGWEGDRQFNALNGARRLIFHAPAHDHKIDVFVDAFEMCHQLPLVERIDVVPLTLPAAELAMTKLQVVSLNPKDRGDLYALLAGLPVSDHDEDAINAQRIAALTARDWGFYHTVELNFDRLIEGLPESGLSAEQRADVVARIDALRAAIDAAPKSRGWKLRAKIGERKRWYDEPEEVDRDVA